MIALESPQGGQIGERECDINDFMTCRPIKFKGEKYPMVVMKWIVKIEHILYTCNCADGLKMGFASHMLKDDALG